MEATEQLTITVPARLATRLRERISSGEFVDASDLVSRSLESFVLGSGQPLAMSDAEFDSWLTAEVLPVYDAMEADPVRGMSINEVRERLAREHAEFSKAG